MATPPRPRDVLTRELIESVTADPWLARYVVCQVALSLRLEDLEYLVLDVQRAEAELRLADLKDLQALVRERFGL